MNTTYKEKWGDIVNEAPDFDAIIHGCNCMHSMGYGIAGQIKKKYPKAYYADLSTGYSDDGKLGKLSVAKIEKKNVTVLNLYSQFLPGPNVVYGAIYKGLSLINLEFAGKKIAIPMIGAGIAGGDWTKIKQIILSSLTSVDLTIIYWEGDKKKFKNEFPK